jgi:glycosyltransferase involved in cell wall biosynthesis
MPSVFECFGVAAVEALSAGAPVLVSPSVGIADAVIEHRCGWVVPPTPPAIASALAALIGDCPQRQVLSVNALRAAADFSTDSHGQRMKAQYEFALAGHRARSHA